MKKMIKFLSSVYNSTDSKICPINLWIITYAEIEISERIVMLLFCQYQFDIFMSVIISVGLAWMLLASSV